MERFNANHRWLVLLVLTGGLLGSESVSVWRERTRAVRARTMLASLRGECDRLTRQSPAPSEANEAALSLDLLAAGKRWQELQSGWPRDPDSFTEESDPVTPSQSYFLLMEYAGRLRDRADRLGVKLKPEEAFGFASFAHEAPPVEQLTVVGRQRRRLEELVSVLLDAQPESLVSVQREWPGADPTTAPDRTREAGDVMQLAPGVTLRAPGLVEGDVFRLVFTGGTGVLRRFLNELASQERPVIVRRVEAVPDEVAAATRFTVTVECLELAREAREPLP